MCTTSTNNKNIIVLSNKEADEKYALTRNNDPFKDDIKPSLLNSADIINYVEKTAMINPFYMEEEFLKPASYSLRVQGKYKYWDSTKMEIEGLLEKDGDFFILKKNTLAFVSIESKLRLPHYIAARFNLQIKHVHRGILLGTGPLVDPGFKGKLFIPLHNLTNNDYKISYNDPLIWMEFTKISDSKEYIDNMSNKQQGKFYAFKESSIDIDPYSYLLKASPHSPIINSLSSLVSDASELQKKTEGLVRGINMITCLALSALLIGLGTYVYCISTIRKESFDYVNQSHEKINYLNSKIDSLGKQIITIKAKQDSLH